MKKKSVTSKTAPKSAPKAKRVVLSKKEKEAIRAAVLCAISLEGGA